MYETLIPENVIEVFFVYEYSWFNQPHIGPRTP